MKPTALRPTGHWARRDLPHSGWRCVDVKDDPTTCQMCEVQRIRIVHVMAHPDVQGELECGANCAGHMSGNPAYAQLREALFRWRLDALRKRPPVEKLRRKGWKGNHGRTTDGDRIYTWTSRDDGRQYVGPSFIVTVREREGSWFHAIRRDWWSRWRDTSGHIHGGPFDSALAAATSGIEQAEILRADPSWMEDDEKGRVINRAAGDAERDESWLKNLTDGGDPDLAADVRNGRISFGNAFAQQHHRRGVAAREDAP